MMARNPQGNRAGKSGGRGKARSTTWLSMLASMALLAGSAANTRADVTDVARDLDLAGWQFIDTGDGRGEWIVSPPAGSQAAGEESPSLPLDEAAVLAIDMAGWERIVTGPGAGEWVVRSDPATSGAPEPLVDVGARDLVLEAIPGVLDAQGTVQFKTQDSRVVSLEIQVFDVTGRLVFSSSEQSGRTLQWNLRDNRGTPLSQGVYFYTAKGRTSAGRSQSSRVGKFVVLGGSLSR